MFTLENGSKVKFVSNKYNGSVVNDYGNKAWYQCGKLHRLAAPAYRICFWS
jgi:hypothetical protein